MIGEIGMSKSSFYHYFRNKTDLFKQTLDMALAPMLEAQDNLDLSLLDAETFWDVFDAFAAGLANGAGWWGCSKVKLSELPVGNF